MQYPTRPKIIGFTVDSVIDTGSTSVPSWLSAFVKAAGGIDGIRRHLWLIAVLVAGVAAVRAVFRYFFEFFNTKGAEKLVKTMRDDLFGHILHLPYAWHSENATGDIIQRCTSDVDTVKTFLSDQLSALLRTLILMGLSLFFMFRIHVRLAAAAAVFIPVIVLYSLFFHSRIGAAFEKADEEEGKLSTIAQENLTGVRVVRAFGRELYERRRFEEQNRIYTGYWVHLMKVLSMFWTSGDLVSYLQTLVILVYGSYLAATGRITAGELIAFISYNELLNWPIRALGRTIAELSKHVSYAYDNGQGEVLRDVSFRIRGGSVFGILGGTGSGKSTLMHLLDRLYDLPDGGGRIMIGDTDISNIQTAYLRQHVGMVLQEPYLFSRTLSENIAITQKRVVLDEVRRAARIASLDDTIDHFTKGYDTYVGERGVTLSGGQKQRTAIAQMLIRQPEIMIFDDSLSAVDAETDAKIREALKKRTAGSTVILISHRISTLMHADSILVLDKGRVAAQGTHRELLEKSPIYRRIYQLQLQGAEEMQENGPEEPQPEGQQTTGIRQIPQEQKEQSEQNEGDIQVRTALPRSAQLNRRQKGDVQAQSAQQGKEER